MNQMKLLETGHLKMAEEPEWETQMHTDFDYQQDNLANKSHETGHRIPWFLLAVLVGLTVVFLHKNNLLPLPH